MSHFRDTLRQLAATEKRAKALRRELATRYGYGPEQMNAMREMLHGRRLPGGLRQRAPVGYFGRPPMRGDIV